MADHVWSPIHYTDNDGNRQVVEVGETTSASKLNLNKEEYQQLKDAGAIRDKKHPNDLRESESPRERNLRVFAEGVREAQENMFSEMPDLLEDEAPQRETPTAKDAVEV